MQFNRFHLLVFLTWQFSLHLCIQNLFPIFSNFIPRWKCLSANLSIDFSHDCRVFEECPKGFLHFEEVFSSAALEFGWICSESGKFFIWAVSTLQFLGVFVGTIVCGALADRMGRKPISIFVLSFGILALALSGLTLEWWQFFLTRFCVGVSVGGTFVVVFIYCIELVLPEHRLLLTIYPNWGTARIVLNTVCYFFPNWRHASLVCCLTCIPALLVVTFIFPESPLWLLTKNNTIKHKKSQDRIRSISGEDVQEPPFVKKQEKVSIKSLWTSKEVLFIFLSLCYSWFTVNVSGYASDLNSHTINGNFFINQFSFAFILMCSKFVIGLLDRFVPQFDRRMMHNYNQLIAALCFLAVTVLLCFDYENMLILILSIFGLTTVSYVWDACYVITAESMPTEIRSTALGICSTVSRVGMLTAPLLVTLSTFWKPTVYLALAIFGFVNFALAWNFLPETKHVNLAEVNLKSNPKIAPTET